MKVLLTGSDGYLGSVIGPELVRAGHAVAGLDTGFFSAEPLYRPKEPPIVTTRKDVREMTADDVAGFDAIVHMADLSNDPAGELAPHVTLAINHAASVRLASLARAARVKRFVYMSSCSVYGIAGDDFVDEESPIRPQTVYATCKARVEREVSALAREGFAPTFLRNATAFGASPRMRFDVVINNLAGLAWTTRRIALQSDGTPWRPLVHALDIGAAVLRVLEAPPAIVTGQIINVGATDQNLRIREIAELIADVFGDCAVEYGAHSPDQRSYRVSFEKIGRVLPGFRCAWTPRAGAQQLLETFEAIGLTAERFSAPEFTRLAQLRALRDTGRLDAEFKWRPAAAEQTHGARAT